jgi:hypothetical protein
MECSGELKGHKSVQNTICRIGLSIGYKGRYVHKYLFNADFLEIAGNNCLK